eukprot:579670-Prorocentrum_minimum.AAC.1
MTAYRARALCVDLFAREGAVARRDNAKKYIEAGRTTEAQALGGKGSDAHTAAVIGDTVGDPLKDTSGPSLNILIKLMAVESLVFASFFKEKTPDGLIFRMFSDESS